MANTPKQAVRLILGQGNDKVLYLHQLQADGSTRSFLPGGYIIPTVGNDITERDVKQAAVRHLRAFLGVVANEVDIRIISMRRPEHVHRTANGTVWEHTYVSVDNYVGVLTNQMPRVADGFHFIRPADGLFTLPQVERNLAQLYLDSLHTVRQVRVIVRDGDRFLCLHSIRPNGNSGLEFPGGKIDLQDGPPDSDETVVRAAIRELKEETDINVVNNEVTIISGPSTGGIYNTSPISNKMVITYIVYVNTVTHLQCVIMEPAKCNHMQFLSLNEIRMSGFNTAFKRFYDHVFIAQMTHPRVLAMPNTMVRLPSPPVAITHGIPALPTMPLLGTGPVRAGRSPFVMPPEYTPSQGVRFAPVSMDTSETSLKLPSKQFKPKEPESFYGMFHTKTSPVFNLEKWVRRVDSYLNDFVDIPDRKKLEYLQAKCEGDAAAYGTAFEAQCDEQGVRPLYADFKNWVLTYDPDIAKTRATAEIDNVKMQSGKVTLFSFELYYQKFNQIAQLAQITDDATKRKMFMDHIHPALRTVLYKELGPDIADPGAKNIRTKTPITYKQVIDTSRMEAKILEKTHKSAHHTDSRLHAYGANTSRRNGKFSNGSSRLHRDRKRPRREQRNTHLYSMFVLEISHDDDYDDYDVILGWLVT